MFMMRQDAGRAGTVAAPQGRVSALPGWPAVPAGTPKEQRRCSAAPRRAVVAQPDRLSPTY